MTYLLSETFAGTGDLDGKTPDVSDPGAHVWASVDVDAYQYRVVLAGGYAASSMPGAIAPTAEQPTSLADLTLSGYGALSGLTVEFGILTGSGDSLGSSWRAPWTFSVAGDLADASSVNLQVSLAGDATSGWELRFSTNGYPYVVVTPTFAPDTLYPCSLSIASGVPTFSGFGQSLELPYLGSDGTFSPTTMHIALGLDTRMDGIALSGPPAAAWFASGFTGTSFGSSLSVLRLPTSGFCGTAFGTATGNTTTYANVSGISDTGFGMPLVSCRAYAPGFTGTEIADPTTYARATARASGSSYASFGKPFILCTAFAAPAPPPAFGLASARASAICEAQGSNSTSLGQAAIGTMSARAMPLSHETRFGRATASRSIRC